jgi:hypothetical protein
MWTEVYADTASKDGVLDALVKGKSYAVHAFEGKKDIEISYVKVIGDTVFAEFNGPITSVESWGKNHSLLGKTEYPNISTVKINQKGQLANSDTYIRYVVKSASCAIYLNPIVRTVNGKTSGVERLVPEINLTQTWFYRLFVLLIEGLILLLFLYIWKIKPFKR